MKDVKRKLKPADTVRVVGERGQCMALCSKNKSADFGAGIWTSYDWSREAEAK